MKNQKGLIQIILVIGILAMLTFIGYLLYIQKQKPGLRKTTGTSNQVVSPVNDTKDLTTVSKDLDSADTTQIDTHLNALNSVTSGF